MTKTTATRTTARKTAARPARKAAVGTAKPARTRASAKTATAAAPKPAEKPATKPTTKPTPKAAKPVKQAKPVAAPKPPKPAKPKLVRDSFTIPKAEYAVIDALKQRAATLASPVKKSELLRAGIKALAAMDEAGFLAAVKAVPPIKTGRPKGKKPEAAVATP